MTIQTNTPPALFQAAKNSTTTWQNDLQLLFNHAKDRFPDVVWELVDDGAPSPKDPEEVWGHKGMFIAPPIASFRGLLITPFPLQPSSMPAHLQASRLDTFPSVPLHQPPQFRILPRPLGPCPTNQQYP